METPNRTPLRPHPLVSWELRIGDLRVYYDVEEDPEQKVIIAAIGIKRRNRVYIGREPYDLMKTIDLQDATEPLAEYVKNMEGEPIMIMHKGVALALLAPAGYDDYESVQMSTNPEFIALLERSRKSYQEEGGIPAEEVRKMFADDKDA